MSAGFYKLVPFDDLKTIEGSSEALPQAPKARAPGPLGDYEPLMSP
jgi:hypothetical protein